MLPVAQLSFTFLVAFLMMRRSTASQLTVTLALLIITESAYRLFAVPGYNQPGRLGAVMVDVLMVL